MSMAPPKDKNEDAPPQSGEEDAPDAAAGVKRPASASGDTGVAKKFAADEKETFKGGCHCGNIRYEVKLDPNNLAATRCNCTFCQKLGTTNFSIENPDSDFKLIKPASRNELNTYAPNTKSAQRFFCSDCGNHVFADGYYEYEGNRIDFFTLNFATLDQPQEGLELSETKIKYWDGLHDNWHAGMTEKPAPGGLI